MTATRLGAYLGAGVGFAGVTGQCDAATLVTIYGTGTQSMSLDRTLTVVTPGEYGDYTYHYAIHTDVTLSVDLDVYGSLYGGNLQMQQTKTSIEYSTVNPYQSMFWGKSDGTGYLPYDYFVRGNQEFETSSLGTGTIWAITNFEGIPGVTPLNGALLGSSDNYINFDADGDGVLDSVMQFSFGQENGAYIVGLATNDDGAAMNVAQGKGAIDAVPEPSSLALLALGSAGLLARRRRIAC